VDRDEAARLLGRMADQVPVAPVPVDRLVDAARRQRRRRLWTAAVVAALLAAALLPAFL
jgi:hypothetical protein